MYNEARLNDQAYCNYKNIELPPPVPRAHPSELEVKGEFPGLGHYSVSVSMPVLTSDEAMNDYIKSHCVQHEPIDRDPLTVLDLQALSPVPEWLRMEHGALKLAKKRMGFPADKYDFDYGPVLDWSSPEEGIQSIRSRHSHSMPSPLFETKAQHLDQGLLGARIEDIFGPFHSDEKIREYAWGSFVYLGGVYRFKLKNGNVIEVS